MRRRGGAPELSIVMIVHQMRREAPRTLLSLSPGYQRNVGAGDYEVVVVENGSTEPLSQPDVEASGPNVRYRAVDVGPSPAAAVNLGIGIARGRHVGVLLDGARMVTPGMVHHALAALRLHDRAVVASLAWHLGPDHQLRSVADGYDRATEDGLLELIGWPADGYRLFEVASLAGSNEAGWFGPISESCCLFAPRTLFEEIGGYDERFDLPGGGLLNLDVFRTLSELPGADVVVLLGEGSFHQLHGGAAANATTDSLPAYLAQYERIRGRPWSPPARPATYLGTMPPAALRFLGPY
jgi:hypothetical protein